MYVQGGPRSVARVKMQNRERLQVQSTSVVDFNSTNMLDVSTITLYHFFKATPPFTDTSVKKRL